MPKAKHRNQLSAVNHTCDITIYLHPRQCYGHQAVPVGVRLFGILPRNETVSKPIMYLESISAITNN